jgi:hypothetical protein
MFSKVTSCSLKRLPAKAQCHLKFLPEFRSACENKIWELCFIYELPRSSSIGVVISKGCAGLVFLETLPKAWL